MLLTEAEQTQVIRIFYCYAREDKALRDELDARLGPMKRLGLITTWYDRQILPGTEWKREIDTRLDTADVVLLLISAYFINSDYCYGIEMRRALERHQAGQAHVIPVILRPIAWQETPIGQLQALPTDGKPITKWRNRDEAFLTVAQGIRDVVELLMKRREQASQTLLFMSYTHADPQIIQPRERDVKEVYAQLIRPDISVLALTGIAGIGKSTLADLVVNYAEKQRGDGRGPFLAQPFWLRVDPAVTLLHLTEKIFDALGKPLPDFQHLSPQDQARTLFHALNTTETPRLVILDQFENLLNWQTGQVLPTGPDVGEWLSILNKQPCTSRVLLTSRLLPKGGIEDTPLFTREYTISGLASDEGVDLLRKRGVSIQQETDDALQRAVVHTKGHALALAILASILQMNKSLKIEYLFSNSIYRLQWREDIAASDLLNYLYKQQLNETQRKLLRAFSLYREPVSLDAAQIFLQKIPEKHILLALNVLLKHHLLQATGEGQYQLHSVLATYAQSRFDKRSEGLNKKALLIAHEKAAAYYQHSYAVAYPLHEKRSRTSWHTAIS